MDERNLSSKKPFFGFFFHEDKLMYADKYMRIKIDDCDSWEFLKSHFGFKTDNYFSYNPLTKEYHSSWRSYDGKRITEHTTPVTDQIKDLVNKLDWSEIFPQLIVRPYINMFNVLNQVTEEDIKDVLSLRKQVLNDSLFYKKATDGLNYHLHGAIADCFCDDLKRTIGLEDIDFRDFIAHGSMFQKCYLCSFIKHESIIDFSPVIRLRERGFVLTVIDNKTSLCNGPKSIQWQEYL